MKAFSNLSICVLISFIGLTVCVTKPECISQFEELWPHPNPNHFWYCHEKGSVARDLPCPEGRGFLRNDERSGCIPYSDWKCTSNAGPPSCTTEAEYNKPHRHSNPNLFWACPEPMGTPATELRCEAGRAFVDNAANLGCVPYEDWICNEANNKIRE